MSNFKDIMAIRRFFLDTWGDTPVLLDNETPVDEPVGIYARFTVKPDKTFRKSIARRTYERTGRVYLQVIVPEGDSDADGWALIDAFNNTFTDWSSPDYSIRFDTPTVGNDQEEDCLVLKSSLFYTATDDVSTS